MRRQVFRFTGAAAFGLALGAASSPAGAEVTRVVVERREDVLGGKAFGDVGPYEKLVGKVHFAVDPKNPRNAVIADVNLAPKNAQGKVEFSSDFYVIKPKDPGKGNGVALFDMVNRGGKALLRVFNRAAASPDPTTEAEFGDGYLMRQGYTLAMVGWQFDVGEGKALVGFDAPIATDKGKPITGWVRMWFLSNQAVPAFEYAGTSYNTKAYPPLDPANREYRLTERVGTYAPSRLIPRDEWQFARVDKDTGAVVPDPNWIHLKSGLKPGVTYEVAYETKNPPVAGLGLAAIRDVASAMKNDPRFVAPARYAYIFGSSQTGRGIRHLVYEGFTIDEKERKALDAALVQTGATGYGSFNQRFAQPNELGSFTQTKFPFLYKVTVDPVTGRKDGMGVRVPAGLEPKMMLVDSSSEYWDRGRVAALRHTSPDGSADVEDAPNVRVYLLAGTRHGAGSYPPGDTPLGMFKENTNDYRWAQRGLLAALDEWVRKGTEPPPSRHPRLADGTLVPRDKLEFPSIPGVRWPDRAPGGFRSDVSGPDAPLAFMVSKVDADGNEVGGIRLPEQAVPLATLTGWQFRSERIGSPDTLLAMAGAYLPFPATRAERERAKDPRPSIEERYGSKDGYLAKVRESAASLARERYILADDVDAIVQAAGRHWDGIMGPAAAEAPTVR